ncbi:unnamed protein product, partial [Mesorhabditis spiculigera]
MPVANVGDLSQMLQMGDMFPEHLKDLPKDVIRRVKALKTNQLEGIKIECEFYERVHQLEKEFESKFNTVFQQRRAIVAGEREPTDAEVADIKIIHGVTDEDLESTFANSPETSGDKGIPNFWLHVLESCDSTSEMIHEHDKEVLKYLIDITTTVHGAPEEGFTLFFHFAQNPYFSNSVLTKRYYMQNKPDPEAPFEYDGPSVVRSVGENIEWNDQMDITKKVIKKKQKKGPNAGKFLTKTVKNDSFFNFFDPPAPCSPDTHNEDDEDDLESHDLMRADYEIGQIMRDVLVPRAVLFYTGEQTDDDFMGDDFEEDDDDEDEEDEEEDSLEDEARECWYNCVLDKSRVIDEEEPRTSDGSWFGGAMTNAIFDTRHCDRILAAGLYMIDTLSSYELAPEFLATLAPYYENRGELAARILLNDERCVGVLLILFKLRDNFDSTDSLWQPRHLIIEVLRRFRFVPDVLIEWLPSEPASIVLLNRILQELIVPEKWALWRDAISDVSERLATTFRTDRVGPRPDDIVIVIEQLAGQITDHKTFRFGCQEPRIVETPPAPILDASVSGFAKMIVALEAKLDPAVIGFDTTTLRNKIQQFKRLLVGSTHL